MINSHACGRLAMTWGLVYTMTLLAGCADTPTVVDRQFGASLRQIQTAQSVHLHHTPTAYPPMVSDGTSGKAAIDRFHKSYETPMPPGNIFNIGVGTPMTAQPAR